MQTIETLNRQVNILSKQVAEQIQLLNSNTSQPVPGFVVDDFIEIADVKVYLESTYEDAPVTFKVYAPQLTDGGMVYTKIDKEANLWVSQPITKVV